MENGGGGSEYSAVEVEVVQHNRSNLAMRTVKSEVESLLRAREAQDSSTTPEQLRPAR